MATGTAKRFTDEDRVSESSRKCAVVTKSDTDDLAWVTTRIEIGGAGTLAVVMENNDLVEMGSFPAGHVFKIRARQVRSTNTSATAIVAYFD